MLMTYYVLVQDLGIKSSLTIVSDEHMLLLLVVCLTFTDEGQKVEVSINLDKQRKIIGVIMTTNEGVIGAFLKVAR